MPEPNVGATGEAELTVTEAVVESFADLTTDRNRLHIDDEYATDTPLGERVAHGMLTASVISAAVTDLPGPQLLYLGQDMRFEAPVYLGDTVHATARVTEYESEDRLSVETVARTDEGTVLTGEARLTLLAD